MCGSFDLSRFRKHARAFSHDSVKLDLGCDFAVTLGNLETFARGVTTSDIRSPKIQCFSKLAQCVGEIELRVAGALNVDACLNLLDPFVRPATVCECPAVHGHRPYSFL